MKHHFVFFIAAIAALSGFLFGFDTGVISGAILFVQHDFALSTEMVEVVVCTVLLGAALGAFVSGRLTDLLGRRNMVLIAAVMFVIGSALSGLAPSTAWIISARLLVGIAIGIASYTAPLYISEIAPAKHRGALLLINTITVTGGIVVAYLVDYALAPQQDWRWMFGVGVFPALLLGVGILFLPKSPRWVAGRGQLHLARNILHKLRKPHEVEAELTEIKNNLNSNKHKKQWRDVFARKMRPLLLIGCGLAVIQQVTGINTILYYAPYIFKSAGFAGTQAQLLATIGMGSINFLMSIVAMLIIDRVGRRRLLLTGLSIMCISLAVVGFVFHHGMHSQFDRLTLIIALVCFIGSYAMSPGCIFWLLIAEIYPLDIRGAAMSVAASTNWIANLLVALTFLSLLKYFGPDFTFWLYASAGFASWLFCFFLVPETKGVSLETIERNLHAGLPTRCLGEQN